jgi:hypothetical protein
MSKYPSYETSSRARSVATSARHVALAEELVLTDEWQTVAQASKPFKQDAEYLRQRIWRRKIKAEKFPGTRVWVIYETSLEAHQKQMKQLGSDKFNPLSANW